MDLHELFDTQSFERRYNGLELSLHEYGIKSVLIADSFEDV